MSLASKCPLNFARGRDGPFSTKINLGHIDNWFQCPIRHINDECLGQSTFDGTLYINISDKVFLWYIHSEVIHDFMLAIATLINMARCHMADLKMITFSANNINILVIVLTFQ